MSSQEYCGRHSIHYPGRSCPRCDAEERHSELLNAAEESRAETVDAMRTSDYRRANPGDYKCPECHFVSLKKGASRCPLCRSRVGPDYWDGEARREEALEAAAVVAGRAAVVAKRAAAAAHRAAYDRATWGLRGRHLAFAIIVAGLWWRLRQYTIWLPDAHPQYVGATLAVLSQYVGGTLGATIVCIGLALVVPRLPREVIAMLVFVFLCVVELGQLSRAHWIEDVRLTWLGGMVLGDGFRWSRLLCYAIGTLPLIDENDVVGFWRLLLTVLFTGACVALLQFARAVWQT
jgi:hypothetical protein